GRYDVTISISDDGHGNPGAIATDRQTIHLVARGSNRAPILAPIADPVVAEGQLLTIAESASDQDGDGLLYSGANLPPGAIFDRVRGVLTWTPSFYQAGSYPGIVLRASDGNLTSSRTFTIHVTNTNQVPVLAPLPPQAGFEGVPFQLALS